MLHGSYMLRLEEARGDDPLRLALRSDFPKATFGYHLQRSACFDRWKSASIAPKDARKSLEHFLLCRRRDVIAETAKRKHLTAIVPFDSRLSSGFRFADSTLEALLHLQDMLFRYRRGVWQFH
jgi:hypothetical protein